MVGRLESTRFRCSTTHTRALRLLALWLALSLIVCGFSSCRLPQSEPEDLSIEGVGALAEIAPQELDDADLARVVRTAAQQRAVSEVDGERLGEIYAAHVGRFATAFFERAADGTATFTAAEAERYLRLVAPHRSSREDVRRATQTEIGRRLGDAVRVQEFPVLARLLAAPTAGFARAVGRVLASAAQPLQARSPQTQGSETPTLEASVNGTVNSLYYHSIATLRGEGAPDPRPDPAEESAARRWGAKQAAFFACVMVARRRAGRGDQRAARFISALREYDEALARDDERILAPDGLPFAPSMLMDSQRATLDAVTSGLPTARGGERLERQQAAAYRIAAVILPLLNEFDNDVGVDG